MLMTSTSSVSTDYKDFLRSIIMLIGDYFFDITWV